MIKTTTAVKKYQNALLIGSEVPEKERSFFLMYLSPHLQEAAIQY
jgi:hypothetical protein